MEKKGTIISLIFVAIIAICAVCYIIFTGITAREYNYVQLEVNPRVEFICDNKVTFTYITLEDLQRVNAEEGDHEGLVEVGRDIEGVEVSIFIREIEGSVAPYKRLLSKSYLYEILADKDELEWVLNTSMMATSKENKIVRLTVKPEESII